VYGAMMHHLPPLPILLNYRMIGAGTATDHNRIVAALEYCDRVREVVYIGSDAVLDKFLKAMKRSSRAGEPRT
jgi:hypothetical protein